MAVLPIVRFPEPSLTQPTRPVERITPAIDQLIGDLIDTMRHHQRCVGLSAPQVGSPWRVAVLDVTGHPKAAHSSGLMVLVNPQLMAQGGPAIGREGCLSVPDLTGNVRRTPRVQLRAMDVRGKPWMRRLEGFEAIAAQHEVDHLDGKLFLDHVANFKADVFQRKTYR